MMIRNPFTGERIERSRPTTGPRDRPGLAAFAVARSETGAGYFKYYCWRLTSIDANNLHRFSMLARSNHHRTAITVRLLT